jgi:hypothetical protein
MEKRKEKGLEIQEKRKAARTPSTLGLSAQTSPARCPCACPRPSKRWVPPVGVGPCSLARLLPPCPVGPPHQRRCAFAHTRSCWLAGSARQTRPLPPQSQRPCRALARSIVLTSPRPAHAARALGEYPAHSLSSSYLTFPLSLPSHSPSRSAPRCCFTVMPLSLDFCQRFGHGDLRLSLAHREPMVVSPFLNSSARSVLNLSPAQVGARRRDSSTCGQPEPPRVVPSCPKRRL